MFCFLFIKNFQIRIVCNVIYRSKGNSFGNNFALLRSSHTCTFWRKINPRESPIFEKSDLWSVGWSAPKSFKNDVKSPAKSFQIATSVNNIKQEPFIDDICRYFIDKKV